MSVDPDQFIPKTQGNFRLDQVAQIFSCSVNHLFNLIEDGELACPKENIEKAVSRPGILVPRESLCDFVRRRSSPEWFESERRERPKRKQSKKGSR
jgi:hypothetical protein